ncbi:Uma2 family endonuclease [Kovacikia minuta CCNUW1]|uniref:Uma2 family endonuclease n=1 Tax=Kovacikia minuta TaxID=2931930 RepID=UPI001CCDCC2E|nr:Uma2 family endonuclease [Kovacikia minuta]UBF27773.1 Uma2 family endonuclease [Kovacikia minuta CCNUW1]
MAQLLERTTDQISVYPNRTWDQFKHIQKGLEGTPGVRLFYYEGVVEILMPGLAHEIFKKIIGYLLETFFFENQIKVVPTGSVTQEQEGEASAQADESYCIGEAKPIPDLAIEVIFTSGSTTKLKRYQALGVPEVWFWEDGALSLYHLRQRGYVQVDQSEIPELAGLDLDLFCRCVLIGETDWLEAVRTFKQGIGQSRG